MTRLTLDTNLLQEYWRDQTKHNVVQQLLALGRSGEVDLAVTDRISDDIPSGPLADRLRELPDLGIGQIGATFRLDHSALNGRDMFGSDVFEGIKKKADAELLRRGRAAVPDWRDWDHLHGHFLKHRDVFLTWDKRLLEAARFVAMHLPVTAMTPETYLATRSISQDALERSADPTD